MNPLNEIINFWAQAGCFVLPLLLISICCWFWLLSLYLKLNQSEFRTSNYESEITHRLLDGKSHQSIRQWICSQKGMVPRIVEYVFQGSSSNSREIEGRYLEASESEIRTIEKEFSVLGALVTAAPLLGLLGTVAGMVDTFTALGNVSGMATVSSGISKALLTTQLGLLVALPGFFGMAYLKRKYRRLVIELHRLQFHVHALREVYK
jgi:biopolymer transport protein ExbB